MLETMIDEMLKASDNNDIETVKTLVERILKEVA